MIKQHMVMLALAAGLCVAPGMAGPALAQQETGAGVKDGVDAWSRGDYPTAVRLWQAEAAKGDPDAQFNLAQAYRLGRGVEPDLARAEDYYAKAAAQGHLRAADNYGILMFQDGRREQALPYVNAAAERGDPRAQYLLGIAHFNGDLVPRDWVRAYALMTLAHGAGLPQAAPALAEMDRHVPLAQRQMGAGLAPEMRQKADARRTQEMATADFAMGQDGPTRQIAHVPTHMPTVAQPAQPAAAPAPESKPTPAPSAQAGADAAAQAAQDALAAAHTASGADSPAGAGADYARPANTAAAPSSPPSAQTPVSAPASVPASTPAPAAAKPASSGPWRVQLGAFSQPGNAERLWAQLGGKGVLAGKTRIMQQDGRLTRLLAGGFATRADAQSACSVLKQGGHACLVTR